MKSATNVGDMFKNNTALTTIAGFQNLGKAFVSSSGTHILSLLESRNLTKQSVLNIINTVSAPDDTTVTDSEIILHPDVYALLDASDIAIATAKRWSVTTRIS